MITRRQSKCDMLGISRRGYSLMTHAAYEVKEIDYAPHETSLE